MSESSDAKTFETLRAWKEARILAQMTYVITRQGGLPKDYGLSNQMQRSVVSIAGNIAEGYGRGRPAELHQFLAIALGSLAELRSHYYIALDAGYLDAEAFDSLYQQLDTVARLIAVFRRWNRERP